MKQEDMPYGLVKVIKGKYKGRFVYYDDDNGSNVVIYLGSMITNPIEIKFSNITNDFTMFDLYDRLEKIDDDYDDDQELLECEKRRITGEIINRYQKTMNLINPILSKVVISSTEYDSDYLVSYILDANRKGIRCNMIVATNNENEKLSTRIRDYQNCKYLFLAVSEDSVNVNSMQEEWKILLTSKEVKNLKVILIKLDNCNIPDFLKDKEIIDFTDNYNENLEKLCEKVSS